MTRDQVLKEILNRIAANKGKAILITQYELDSWPNEAVTACTNCQLLEQAPQAKYVTCSGCDRGCTMPVHTRSNSSGNTSSFIICDKRDDINSVLVPTNHTKQFQISCTAIAKIIAYLLDIQHTQTLNPNPVQWEIGVLKRKHSSHIVLIIDEQLKLSLAGHSVLLSEVLSIENSMMQIDKKRLLNLVDNPTDGGGKDESARARRERLRKRHAELVQLEYKDPIQIMAREEGVTPRWIHKLLEPSKTKNTSH